MYNETRIAAEDRLLNAGWNVGDDGSFYKNGTRIAFDEDGMGYYSLKGDDNGQNQTWEMFAFYPYEGR